MCAAAAAKLNLLLLAFAWIVGGALCTSPSQEYPGSPPHHSRSYSRCPWAAPLLPQLSRADSRIFGFRFWLQGQRQQQIQVQWNPPDVWYDNMLSVVIPLRTHRSRPPNGGLSSKHGHAGFCIRRESTEGGSHSVLSSNDGVLYVSGRAWARGSQGGTTG